MSFDPREKDGTTLDLRPPQRGVVEQIAGVFRNVFSKRPQEPEGVDFTVWMLAGLAEGAIGITAQTVDDLVRDGRLRSRRLGETVLVLREDVNREAKARIIKIRATTEGSESGATSIATDAPKVGPPIVVEPSPPAKEIIQEVAILRGPIRG